MNQNRLKKIKKAVFRRPYLFYFLFFFFIFIFLNIAINRVDITYQVLYDNLKLGIPFVFFNILVAGLVALNINLVIIKFKELGPNDNSAKKELGKKSVGLTFLGIFGGFLGGACPGCFVGLFPAFLGLFGVSASLSVLPLYGIEIQIVSTVLLIISTYLLTNNPICKVELPVN